MIPVQVLKHWPILKKCFNGKRVPIIPLSLVNNRKSDFKIKATYFDSFFASNCIPLVNNSIIPNLLKYVSTARLSAFCFILKPINALNINKAHGHDDKSIWMIKLCNKSVVKSLLMISKNCLNTSTFSDI